MNDLLISAIAITLQLLSAGYLTVITTRTANALRQITGKAK